MLVAPLENERTKRKTLRENLIAQPSVRIIILVPIRLADGPLKRRVIIAVSAPINCLQTSAQS